MKKFLPLIFVVAVLAVAIPMLAQHRMQPGLGVGDRAPDFTLNDLDGNPVSLGDFRGRVVMMNFWSAACPPCREKMPEMQNVYDELNDEGFTILAINVNDTPRMARRFLEENNYTFPIAKDDGEVSRLYEVQFIPKTLLLDREGIIRFVTVGPVVEEQLRELVKGWL